LGNRPKGFFNKSKSEVWDDIKLVQGKESIGYPTPKPKSLLERIVKMASNEGVVVLDPFMGGGTTMAVAEKLNRQWIGIDQSVQAVKVTDLRLQKQMDMFKAVNDDGLEGLEVFKLKVNGVVKNVTFFVETTFFFNVVFLPH